MFDSPTFLIILASIGGFFMAFNNGANDVSNAFASAVGSKAINMRFALVLASIFTFIGAIFFGGKVAFRLIEGLVDTSAFINPTHYALAMLSVLFSAGLFVFFSTLTSLPVSCTHSIVGSLTGVNLVVMGWSGIDWQALGLIALSWLSSPIMAGLLAWGIIYGLERFILIKGEKQNIRRHLMRRLPLLMASLVCVAFYCIMQSSTHPFLLHLHEGWKLGASLILFFLTIALLRRTLFRWHKKYKNHERASTQAFKRLQAWTACAVAFGNGANDVSNSISPLLAVSWVLSYGHLPKAEEVSNIPIWILCIGAIGIVFGIMTLGHRVMDTLGNKITSLTPQKGFAVDLSVATVLIGASAAGIPISTTHATTGSIIGVGLSTQRRAIHIHILAKIFLTWIFTVPLAALLTVLIYKLLIAISAL